MSVARLMNNTKWDEVRLGMYLPFRDVSAGTSLIGSPGTVPNPQLDIRLGVAMLRRR